MNNTMDEIIIQDDLEDRFFQFASNNVMIAAIEPLQNEPRIEIIRNPLVHEFKIFCEKWTAHQKPNKYLRATIDRETNDFYLFPGELVHREFIKLQIAKKSKAMKAKVSFNNVQEAYTIYIDLSKKILRLTDTFVMNMIGDFGEGDKRYLELISVVLPILQGNETVQRLFKGFRLEDYCGIYEEVNNEALVI